jgi:hypothetical protein
MTDASANWSDGRVATDSLRLCGGGMGWGVAQYGTAVPPRTTPTPIPSQQGGREEFAAVALPELLAQCLWLALLPDPPPQAGKGAAQRVPP